ncbi:hypothetical protein ONY95_003276 [Vibrio parahaemolyticus]|nr:hypothetical protein [Vibrio parahaemolyticus]
MCSLFIDLNHHHSILNIDLKKLASQQKSIQMKMKLLALAHFKDGYSHTNRPRAEKQQFEYAYLFGSICPRKGICEAIVVSWVNKDIMIEHLKQILAVTEEGCRAVVVMDGGG